MRPIQSVLKKISMLLVMTVSFLAGHAQGATEPVQNVTSSTNQVAILMIVIALVLAFVIYALGQVLFTMGRQALEKSRQGQKAASIIMLLGLSFAGLTSQAQEAAAEAVNVLPNYGGMSGTTFWTFIAVIATEVLVILFMMFSIRRIQSELMPESAKAKNQTLSKWWSEVDKKLFTRAVPVEKEADVLLDHDYDGIRELDNALPPWWKYGFYITIGVAVFYMFNYHVMGYGMNPTQEYEAEIAKAKAKAEVFASTKADKVDENNIQMPDATGLAKGKDLYATNCWACHGKLGEGGAGPNLTDDYWIHKGSLNDIYKSIKIGYPDKGMQAWDKNFSPSEISYLTGYIKTMKGTNPPNGKAPQGDLYTEEAPVATADSAAATIAPVAPAAGDSAVKAAK